MHRTMQKWHRLKSSFIPQYRRVVRSHHLKMSTVAIESVQIGEKDSTCVYYEKWLTSSPSNNNTTIIQLHGAPGSHRDYRHISPLLAEKVNVISFDLPGFGLSMDAPHRRTSTTELAQVVEQALDHCSHDLANQKLILLGHSFGGHLAMEIAARDPSRYSGLCLLSSAGMSPHKALRPFGIYQWIARFLDHPVSHDATARMIYFYYRRILRFPSTTTKADVVHAAHWIYSTDFNDLQARVQKVQGLPVLCAVRNKSGDKRFIRSNPCVSLSSIP